MSVDASGLEMLSEREALALLATVPLGRLVYSDRALPFVAPVSFVLDGPDIVIRTGRRSNLATNGPGNIVAFQVDDIAVSTGFGWTVVVTGRLQLVHDVAQIARLSELTFRSWAPSASDRYLQLRPELITGHRVASATDY